MGKNKRRIAVIAAVSAIALAGGVAWAAWTTSGTGSASATAGNASGVIVSSGTVAGTPLVPGAKRDLQFTIKNNNEFPVKITGIDLKDEVSATDLDTDAVEVSGAAPLAACQAAHGVSLWNAGVATTSLSSPSGLVATDGTVTIPGGGISRSFVIASAVAMSNASDDSCQGKSFQLDLAISSLSAA